MDPHELIASLEARGDQDDTIIQNLIAGLKARAAIAADLELLTVRHIELRAARAALIVEAAFSAMDADNKAASRHLHAMFGMVRP